MRGSKQASKQAVAWLRVYISQSGIFIVVSVQQNKQNEDYTLCSLGCIFFCIVLEFEDTYHKPFLMISWWDFITFPRLSRNIILPLWETICLQVNFENKITTPSTNWFYTNHLQCHFQIYMDCTEEDLHHIP